MKLAIINLTRGDLSLGYRKYLQELLPRLARHPLVTRLEVFVPPKFVTQISEDSAISIRPCEDNWTGLWLLRRDLAEVAPQVVFFPSPRGFNLGGTPYVCMIRNMEPLALPCGGNAYRETLKNLARRYAARAACRRATRILATSHFVKDFLIKTWRIDPDKIGIVYHGADNRPSGFEEARPGAIPSDCQEGFLFTAGSIRPARGLEDLLRALADLAAAGKRLPLVIAGEADSSSPAYERSMKDLVVNLGICNQVVWTGHLTSKEMAWCYSRASLFIMTSRVEACPNIALEAMSHGSGCIVADNPPLPEFFRDAARYYLPGDSRSLVEAIGAYQASSPEVQKSLRLRAQAYASSFTWDKTAEETVKELMLACESYTR